MDSIENAMKRKLLLLAGALVLQILVIVSCMYFYGWRLAAIIFISQWAHNMEKH